MTTTVEVVEDTSDQGFFSNFSGVPLFREAPQDFTAAGLGSTEDSGDAIIGFKLSDAGVAADGHTLANDGWDLSRAETNCPVLWAHESKNLNSVLGQWKNFQVREDGLYAEAHFMPRSLNPVAGTVIDMVRRGYLRMCSVGYIPIAGRRSTAAGRSGYDFTRQTLLEASIVPIGSLASTLVSARDAGVHVQPLMEWARDVVNLAERDSGSLWKVGASEDLPLKMTGTWDGPAAAGRMFSAAGFDGDNPDYLEVRKGFLVYDSANPGLRGSYKLPFADIVGGALKAVASGVRAAASRLPQTNVPKGVADRARKVLDVYEGEMVKAVKGDRSAVIAAFRTFGLRRGMAEVQGLAEIVMYLAQLKSRVEAEELSEGDSASQMPPVVRKLLEDAGAALVAMTAEEVAELLTDVTSGDSEDPGDVGDPGDAATVENRGAGTLTRPGREVYGDSVRRLREVHGNLAEAASALSEVIDSMRGTPATEDGSVPSSVRDAQLKDLENRLRYALL